MLTKQPGSLAAEVASNRHATGLKENHLYRFERYRETLSLNAFIAYDPQRLNGEAAPAVSTHAPLFGLPFPVKTTSTLAGLRRPQVRRDWPISCLKKTPPLLHA